MYFLHYDITISRHHFRPGALAAAGPFAGGEPPADRFETLLVRLHLLRMRLERRTPRRTAIQRPRRCPHAARSDAAPHGGGRHAARRHHLRRQRRANPASRIRSGDRRYDRPARHIVPVGQGLGALERHPAPPRRGAPRPCCGWTTTSSNSTRRSTPRRV